jgi:hypothetical protein
MILYHGLTFLPIGFFCENKRRERRNDDKNTEKIKDARLQEDTMHYFMTALR